MGDNKQENSSWFRSITLRNSGKKLNIKYVFVLLSLGILFMIVGSFMKSGNDPSSVPVLQEDQEESEQEEQTSEVFMSSDKPKEVSTMAEYENLYESQLAKALEEVVGLSDVSVVVNLAETEKMVYQKNVNTKEQITEETDSEGGLREVQDNTKDEQVVIIRNGDKEEPLVIKKEKPNIRGVLVVANGVENIQVKTWVVEAVSRVLDVPSHRVSVLPKKTKEE